MTLEDVHKKMVYSASIQDTPRRESLTNGWTKKRRAHNDIPVTAIFDDSGAMVAEAFTDKTAALIVRAVSMHEEMITCLERIRGDGLLFKDKEITKWVDDLLHTDGR